MYKSSILRYNAEVVDLGDVQIPLDYIADCSLSPPSGVVVNCSGFPLLTTDENKWWEVRGQPVFMAHNTTYLKPGEKPPRGILNPGAEIMNHTGRCVSFGNLGKFTIGEFVKKSRVIAWLRDNFPRVMTSAGEAKKIVPYEADKDTTMVYEAPLTPCETLDTLTPRGDVTFYEVKTGDNLSKIARRYGVTLEQLADANNIKINVNGRAIIWPGEDLIIPTPTP